MKATDALGRRKETAGDVSSGGKPWLWELPKHTHAWHRLPWPLVLHSGLQRLETVLPLLYGQAFYFTGEEKKTLNAKQPASVIQ